MAKKLTDLSVRALKAKPELDPEGKPTGKLLGREVPDAGAPGLYIIIRSSGRHGYCVRYRRPGSGKTAKLTLPRGIGLAQARKFAADAMLQVAQGLDPGLAKMSAKRKATDAAANTLKAIAENYLAREGKKLRSVDQRRAAFNRLIYPVIGARPIADIKRSEIVKLLDLIEDRNGPRMAHVVLAYLSKVFGWHAARDDDFRSPIIRGMGRVNAKERARTRVLSDDELKAVWAATEGSQRPFDLLVRFLLLSGARRNEAARMTRGGAERAAIGCCRPPETR